MKRLEGRVLYSSACAARARSAARVFSRLIPLPRNAGLDHIRRSDLPLMSSFCSRKYHINQGKKEWRLNGYKHVRTAKHILVPVWTNVHVRKNYRYLCFNSIHFPRSYITSENDCLCPFEKMRLVQIFTLRVFLPMLLNKQYNGNQRILRQQQ